MSDATEKRSSRPWFIVGLVAVLLLFVGGFFIFIVASQKDTPSPEPTSSAPSTSAPVSDSVCGLEGFEPESTLDSAPDADWSLVGTLASPSNETSGPGIIEADGFRSCYARTAEGALFAVANFVAIGTDASLREQQLLLIASGPGRDAVRDALGEGEPSNLRGAIAGFQVGSYTSDGATVDLVIGYSDGRLVSVPVKVIWEDGDWKVVFTSAGQTPLSPAIIANLGGYIPWGN